MIIDVRFLNEIEKLRPFPYEKSFFGKNSIDNSQNKINECGDLN